MISTYLEYKIYANNMQQTLQRTASQAANQRQTQYYEKNIGNVKTVSDFVNNYQLFSYAMQAFGLQDMTSAKAFMTKVLQSDLSNANSFANKLSDARYGAFARAFSFLTTGGTANTATVQSTDQQNDTLGLYSQKSTASSSSVSAAESYYQSNIGSVKTVDGLLENSQLMSVVLTAYGIDPKTSTSTLKAALESDASDPNSAANKSGNAGIEALAKDFNFKADGSVTDQRLAQTQTDFKAMSKAYLALAGSDSASQATAKDESTYVGNAIAKAATLKDIVGDSRVVAYIGKAFGVPNITAATLSKVLTSNPFDQTSAANQLGENYRQIAAAFNFNTDGTIARQPEQQSQSKAQLSDTVDRFLQGKIQTEAAANSPGAQLALYFQQAAPSLVNAYQILGNKALLTVVQTALGIPASSSTQNIDVQAKNITDRLKLADLKDPVKLNKFISQFAAMYDINNASTAVDLSSPLSILTSSTDANAGNTVLSVLVNAMPSGSSSSASSIAQLFNSSSS